VASMNRLT